MKKKYNVSTIKVKAFTSVEDVEEANGFDVEQKLVGNPVVILNALQAVVAEVLVDTMDDIDSALELFVTGVKKDILEM